MQRTKCRNRTRNKENQEKDVTRERDTQRTAEVAVEHLEHERVEHHILFRTVVFESALFNNNNNNNNSNWLGHGRLPLRGAQESSSRTSKCLTITSHYRQPGLLVGGVSSRRQQQLKIHNRVHVRVHRNDLSHLKDKKQRQATGESNEVTSPEIFSTELLFQVFQKHHSSLCIA